MSHPGVTPDLFRHASQLHGAGHVNRVIALAELLCATLPTRFNAPDETGRRVWAAAYLHDLARRDDDTCHMHGRWAVEEKLEACRPVFAKQGITEDDLPHVLTAVEWHSLDAELSLAHPHWLVTALLKDADCLDRVRLGPDDVIDESYLRLPHTRHFIPLAADLFSFFSHPGWNDMGTIRAVAQEMFARQGTQRPYLFA